MKLTIKQLKSLIRESLAGSHPDEWYNNYLLEDPKFEEKSLYVPDDIKNTISKWAKDMGLTR
jgi:hypothetical protein